MIINFKFWDCFGTICRVAVIQPLNVVGMENNEPIARTSRPSIGWPSNYAIYSSRGGAITYMYTTLSMLQRSCGCTDLCLTHLTYAFEITLTHVPHTTYTLSVGTKRIYVICNMLALHNYINVKRNIFILYKTYANIYTSHSSFIVHTFNFRLFAIHKALASMRVQ